MERMVRSLVGPVLGLLLLNAVDAIAAPCLTPNASCTEYVGVRSGPARVLVYRSHSLTMSAPDITHAIIVIHGAERDAATSFRIAMAASVLHGRPDQMLVIAPRFAARAERGCEDDLAAAEVNWHCDVQLRDWRMGGSAVSDSTLASST